MTERALVLELIDRETDAYEFRLRGCEEAIRRYQTQIEHEYQSKRDCEEYLQQLRDARKALQQRS